MRPYRAADRHAWSAILRHPLAMVAYEGAFDIRMVDEWIIRNGSRRRDTGHALGSVVLRETGEVIGQCGLTRQRIVNDDVTEVGYLFHPDHWGHGYATEAAQACVKRGFETTAADRIYAQVRDTNIASMNVAIRLGMTVRERFTKTYRGVDMPHLAFAVDRPSDEAYRRR